MAAGRLSGSCLVYVTRVLLHTTCAGCARVVRTTAHLRLYKICARPASSDSDWKVLIPSAGLPWKSYVAEVNFWLNRPAHGTREHTRAHDNNMPVVIIKYRDGKNNVFACCVMRERAVCPVSAVPWYSSCNKRNVRANTAVCSADMVTYLATNVCNGK